MTVVRKSYVSDFTFWSVSFFFFSSFLSNRANTKLIDCDFSRRETRPGWLSFGRKKRNERIYLARGAAGTVQVELREMSSSEFLLAVTA